MTNKEILEKLLLVRARIVAGDKLPYALRVAAGHVPEDYQQLVSAVLPGTPKLMLVEAAIDRMKVIIDG